MEKIILIPGYFLFRKKQYKNTGISTYLETLLYCLKKVPSGYKYLILSKNNIDIIPDTENFVLEKVHFPVDNPFFRVLYENLFLDSFVRETNKTIFHSPFINLLIFNRIKNILTVPDLSFFVYPENFVLPKSLYLRTISQISLKKATKIITISKNTKTDIIKYLNIPEKKIKVIYPAVRPFFHPISDTITLENIGKKYQINNKKIILYVGTLEPRKNIPVLIKSFCVLKKKFKIEHSLVLVGAKGWKYEEIFSLKETVGCNDIIFTGFVQEEDLPGIYNLADVFVYPSLYEGFGLPVLEAMACGTPVITSNTSSLPEVVGDAGILVDPSNIEELTDAIFRVISNLSLKEEMRKKATEQAKKFSIEKMAKETISIYKEIFDEI